MTDKQLHHILPIVKELLDAENLDGETYSDTVNRLLGNAKGTTWTEEEIREIATRAAEETIRQYQ